MDRLQRIRRIAGILRRIALLSMAAVAAVGAYPFLSERTEWMAFRHVITRIEPSPAFSADPGLALWLQLLPKAALIYGLLRLARMMAACERGEIFSPQVPVHLQAFAGAIVVEKLLEISLPLQIGALHWLAGREHPVLMFIVRADQLWLLVLALLFLVLAFIAREAVRVAEDSESII